MSTASRRAGSSFERALCDYLRARDLDVERLPLHGTQDEGDLVIRTGGDFIVAEAKVRRDRTTGLSLGTWMGEAVTEAQHFTEARGLLRPAVGILVVKRVNHQIGKSFVIMELDDYIRE